MNATNTQQIHTQKQTHILHTNGTNGTNATNDTPYADATPNDHGAVCKP